MHADQVIHRYVREVAGQLPVRMRSDVTLELNSLLREELLGRAEAAGRAPDEALAIEVVESYGHPREVAHRYHPRWTIIDPADTRAFFMTIVIGFAVLVAFTIPTALLNSEKLPQQGGILVTWIGLVTMFYGAKSWAFRNRPNQRRWNPHRDPDRVNRIAMAALLPVIAITIALFANPDGIFAWLTGGKQLAGSLIYDPGFRASRLPWMFGVWIAQAAMITVLIVRGRWNPLLRRVSMGLSAAFVVLFTWYRADGPIMMDSASNETVKAFMAMIGVLLLIDLAIRIYGDAGHAQAARLRSDAVSR